MSCALRESGVRGRLEPIDDREHLIRPVFRDQVDRPLTIQVTMRTEQPHSRVAGRIHLGEWRLVHYEADILSRVP